MELIKEPLAQWLARPQGDLNLPVLMIDAIRLRDRVILRPWASTPRETGTCRQAARAPGLVAAGQAPGCCSKPARRPAGPLTGQSLGITGALYRTLRTANPLEKLDGSVAHCSRNVERWGDGQMVMPWVAGALSEAFEAPRRAAGEASVLWT